jgi:hypothetical protein
MYAGGEGGAQVGDVYLVLREDGDRLIEVGEAQLVRVSEGFADSRALECDCRGGLPEGAQMG